MVWRSCKDPSGSFQGVFTRNIIDSPHPTCLDSKEIFWCFVIDNSVSRMKLLKHLLCERWEEVLKLWLKVLKLWLTLESHQTLTYEVSKKLVVVSITIRWHIFWGCILIFCSPYVHKVRQWSMVSYRSKDFVAMKAVMLAIWPWLSCQYNKNTLMDEAVNISSQRKETWQMAIYNHKSLNMAL